MRLQQLLAALFLVGWSQAAGSAAAPVLPPGDRAPVLRVEGGGPTAYVAALAFSPDGRTVYAAGWDKVVRVWTADAAGKFVPQPVSYRVPLGPGLAGAINALALSPDGSWLAVGGQGVFREAAGYDKPGWVVDTDGFLSAEMRKDVGMIYLFNTRTGAVRLLRAHPEPVWSLAFAPAQQGKPPLLVSVAARRLEGKDDRRSGEVRLWQVDRDQALATLTGLPDLEARPGLAVWHTGPRPEQVRVGVSCGDGHFRVWDADRPDAPPWDEKDVKYTITAAHLTGPGNVVTASAGKGKATLNQWAVPARQKPAPRVPPQITGLEDWFPRGLALVASRGDGRPDLAAVVVRVPDQQEAYHLELLALDGPNFGAVRARTDVLWKGTRKQPAVAAAPQGRFLAVAGAESHAILVYSVPDLLAGRGEPQILHSVGSAMHYVSFVQSGDALGLALHERSRKTPGGAPRELADGDLIFDFAARTLSTRRQGWTAAGPKVEGWRAEAGVDQARPTVLVYRGDRRVQTVRLPEGHVLSDYVLLPPRPPLTVPVVAVAGELLGQPLFALYNAATGEQLRQYTGHGGPIYALAASPDGRLLASTSEDQTTCVWSLADLDRVVGRLGVLPGLVVRQVGNELRVSQAPGEGATRDRLRVGDVVEGLVEAGRLKPLADRNAFYTAVARTTPGKPVTLRLRGKGDVMLPAAQGVDERKPLFSLFVPRGEDAGRREWIGWNPVGPYESSSRRVERFVGWHRNTGRPEAPASFAPIEQYREQYYREGILQQLVTRGELDRRQVLRQPPPKMALVVEDERNYPAKDARGQVLVRHPRVTLKVAVVGRKLRTLDEVAWKLGDGPEQKFDLERATGVELTAPLELRRGIYRVRVVARGSVPEPEEYSEELTVRYQPEPPKVSLRGDARRAVADPNFAWEMLLGPAPADEAVSLRIARVRQDREQDVETQTYTLRPDRRRETARRLRLDPGYQRIEVTAVNKDALPGYEADETTRLVLEVTHTPPQKARPPVIALDAVVPVHGPGEGSRVTIQPGQAVVVHAPRVRLEGTIEAPENLAAAEWAREPEPRRSLAGFAAGQATKAVVREELQLRPGVQTVRLVARGATSDPTDRTVTLDYRPLVPRVVLTPPAEGPVVYEDGDRDVHEIPLQGQLLAAGERQEYQATVLVNDRELPDRPTLDDANGTLTARVPLRPGDNRVQVRLGNRWGDSFLSEAVRVRYLRPPRVVKVEEPRAEKRPFADVVGQVASPLPPLPDSVRVEVNGTERKAAAVEVAPRGAREWLVRLREVPLDKGPNEVRLWVANAEARARQPGVGAVTFREEARPPVVEWVEPRGDRTVPAGQARVPVRFRVESASPLKRVDLLSGPDDREDQRQSVNLADLKADGEGAFVGTVEVPLARELTHVRVEAVNDGGAKQTPRLTISRPPSSVHLFVDSLTPRGEERPVLTPSEEDPTHFPPAPQGRMTLRGRVVWADEKDRQIAQQRIVRIFVNGVQQVPARLELPRPGSNERAFKADVLLSRDKANQVVVALPGLAQDVNSQEAFVVDCLHPDGNQRLHLLTVNAQAGDPKGPEDEILRALRATTDPGGRIHTPAFQHVYRYEPLVGSYVHPALLYNRLDVIKGRIEDLVRAGQPSNDVVVFYYHGGEAVNAQGNVFVAPDRRTAAITCDELVQFFADTPGAYLLFLDVDRARASAAPEPARDKVAHWEEDYPEAKSHVAVMRYAWLGPRGAPQDVRLLQALATALPRANKLVEVTEQVRKWAVGSSELSFDQYVPGQLGRLVINK